VLLDHVNEPPPATPLLPASRLRRDPEPAFPSIFDEAHLSLTLYHAWRPATRAGIVALLAAIERLPQKAALRDYRPAAVGVTNKLLGG